ncbi:DUF202 domain-containing protein [Actinomadura madurae]|uniref:DUF202 domain-containing protein n=1 Tax=Actinomadura madurae TaxID=1993 RepID=UPI0020D21E71|nr:DUF202 domain-containing protein [Actinomadura madurae]MCP9971095.1 DUF202 domain-containing protein [Actinomadura madurae]
MRLRDPGAQPERTSLAWSRTTLSLIAAGLLCVRLAPRRRRRPARRPSSAAVPR